MLGILWHYKKRKETWCMGTNTHTKPSPYRITFECTSHAIRAKLLYVNIWITSQLWTEQLSLKCREIYQSVNFSATTIECELENGLFLFLNFSDVTMSVKWFRVDSTKPALLQALAANAHYSFQAFIQFNKSCVCVQCATEFLFHLRIQHSTVTEWNVRTIQKLMCFVSTFAFQ